MGVDEQSQRIGAVAQEGEPPGVAHDQVELISVDHEVAPAVGAFVNGMFGEFDPTEAGADVIPQELVVVAWDVDQPRPLADLAQELLYDVVVRLRPVPARFEAPAVDDVPDKINKVSIVAPEEVQQERRLASLRSEVDIRKEKRTDSDRLFCLHHGNSFSGATSKSDSHCNSMTLP